jgi:hypothetical protein
MGKINFDMLNQRLDLVRKQYSAFTYELIRDMVTPKEAKRPDFIALSNRLLPYQEDIRKKVQLPFFRIRGNYEAP